MNKLNQVQFHTSIITGPSGFKYIVTQSPDPNNLKTYKDFLLTNCVNTLIKLCPEDKYDKSFLMHENIEVIDQYLSDGSIPTKEQIDEWIKIMKKLKKDKKNTIACHCMSGLGRAPLFVCVILIKYENMDPVDAVTLVRKSIPRALNKIQLNFLQTLNTTNEKGGCIIC